MDVTDETPKKDWEKKFLDQLRKIPNVFAACRKAGINRMTAYRWRNECPRFAGEWEAALEDAVELLEEDCWKRAQTVSDTMAIFMLKAHRPEKYREMTPAMVDILLKQAGAVESKE